jgi:hypothetical protein
MFGFAWLKGVYLTLSFGPFSWTHFTQEAVQYSRQLQTQPRTRSGLKGFPAGHRKRGRNIA